MISPADHPALRRLQAVLRPDNELCLVVPPFAAELRPQLGVHLMQSVAARNGFRSQVIYANLLFAAQIGEGNYRFIQEADHRHSLLGERLFARAAHKAPAFGWDQGLAMKDRGYSGTDLEELIRIEALIPDWVAQVAEMIAGSACRIVGLSSSFEQINPSIAIARAIKERRPDMILVVGGANCQGPMAQGMADLCPEFDAIFEGEAEASFGRFLQLHRNFPERGAPETQIWAGQQVRRMDDLPRVDYTDYYDQVDRCLPLSVMHLSGQISFAFETSRGCWWGQKHHCTFCGLEPESILFREKSPEPALAELLRLAKVHEARTGSKRIFMVDNIMPFRFFRSFVPALAAAGAGLEIFYEQKANLTLDRVAALKAAGVTRIQPGIEALSDGLLALMDKGTSAHQNVSLLRYAVICGVALDWNLLADFPGDADAMYEETLRLLPLLWHLPAPMRLGRLRIDRFSPYHRRSSDYGISDLQPLSAYGAVLPPDFDANSIAYHFQGKYNGVGTRNPELLERLSRAIDRWIERSAYGPKPELIISRSTDACLLNDTRRLPFAEGEPVSEARARLALGLVSPDRAAAADVDWVLARGLAVMCGGRFTALATAEAGLMATWGSESVQRDGAEHRV